MSDTAIDSRPCPVCGETIKAAALKCRFCNTDLAAFESARQAEVEREVWSGHPAVMLYGIPNLEALADEMRESSLRERTRRRVTTFIET